MSIPDAIFKTLKHSCRGYQEYSRGGPAEKGYDPDYVLNKQNDFIILECENTSSRKTYVGAMIKAAHFLQDERKGILVLVIVPRKNTTVAAIARHLVCYYEWIKEKTTFAKYG